MMISVQIYQWALCCLLCILDSCLSLISINSQTSNGMGFSYREKFEIKHWTHWSEWSECSRSCGNGVKSRSRYCRIRKNGYTSSGKSCFGEAKEYEFCSTHSCSYTENEFLERQCSQRNNHVISGKKINEWIPYRYGTNPCELKCWSKDKSIMQSFGKAVDGTKCLSSESSGICINGRCSPVDCTGKIGSTNKALDKCGVCGGNNSTCIQVNNTYWRRPRTKVHYNDPHFDYEEILSIPPGATNILIRKASKTNFIALADHKKNFYLNGNWRVQSPGYIGVQGLEFLYNRTIEGLEKLSSAGPTTQMLVIYALGSGDVPTIHSEYWLSSSPPTQIQNLQYLETSKKYPQSSKSFDPSNLSIPSTTVNKMPILPKRQGYNSYYHRNEILKSVPSWSIKRHTSYKNPLNILSFQTEQPVTERYYGSEYYQRYFSTPVHDVPTSTRARPMSNINVPFVISNSTGKITPDDIVRFDNYGRPNRTSAQIGRRDKIFQHDVQGRITKTSNHKSNHRRKKIKTASSELLNGIKPSSQRKQLTHNKRKRKSENENCPPCPRTKQQTKNFCLSEFVLRIVVLSVEKQQQNMRYEVEVLRSFKNTVPILNREYIWSSGHCQCPRLRLGKEYILMGHSGIFGNQRESRLVVDNESFVRKYSQKRARRLLRLIRDQNLVCKKF